MAALVTSGNALPGTTLDVTNNRVSVSAGTTLDVSIGIVNTAVFGGWNRLLACTSTYIQMGTRMDLNLAQSVSVSEGDSWLYSGSNNTTYDVASRWGVYLNLFAGGTSLAEKDSRWTEEKQSKMIRSMTIAAFIATVAISLVGIQYPPFKSVGTPVKNGDGVPVADPVTGGLIYDQDKVSGYELNPGGIPVILLETLGVLCLFVGQWILASKMANNLKDFNAVANLSLASNGLTSAVFSDPDRQPRLFPQGTPMPDGTASPRDHYRKLKDDTSVIREGRNFEYVTNMGFDENPRGSSPVATFNMLPGMPEVDVGENGAANLMGPVNYNTYKNWHNLKTGLYPKHDNVPIITLSTELEPYKKTFSSIDMIPGDIFLVTELGAMLKEKGTNRNHEEKKAGAFVQLASGLHPENQTPSSFVSIGQTDVDGNGGVMVIDENQTVISRNSGEGILISAVYSKKKKYYNQNYPQPAPGSDPDLNPEQNSEPINEKNKSLTERNALLKLSAGNACLTTDDGENGVFIKEDEVVIRSGNVNAITIAPTEVYIGSYRFGDESGVDFEYFKVKAPPSTVNRDGGDSRYKAEGFGYYTNSDILGKIAAIRTRINILLEHKVGTGGFSGSLNDDIRKTSVGLAAEHYVEPDGSRYTKTKAANFPSGWGWFKSLKPW
jgi:hypothetical protein